MYRFLVTPKWLIGHVLVGVVVVTFVFLGLWQLDRHDERATRNALVAERMDAPAADLADLSRVDPDDLAYRHVAVTGRYLAGEEVLLTPRSHSGQPGHHVLTPLDTGDGYAVLVDRGWVPFELSDPPVAEAAPPAGAVRLSGLVFPDEPASRFVPGIAAEGQLATVSRADLQRLQRQISLPLRPFYVQAQAQDPAGGELPLAASPPELSGGSHLSYAVQWFLFAAVVLVGYPALARRTALEHRDGVATDDAGDGVLVHEHP